VGVRNDKIGYRLWGMSSSGSKWGAAMTFCEHDADALTRMERWGSLTLK
jgi:hypothetical protein